MTEEHATVEGMSWPIVLLVELSAPQVADLTRELESASIIVLVEGSMLRAANTVVTQRPRVVVAPAAIPVERMQVLHDAVRTIGIEVMRVDARTPIADVVVDVKAAVQRASSSSLPAKKSR